MMRLTVLNWVAMPALAPDAGWLFCWKEYRCPSL